MGSNGSTQGRHIPEIEEAIAPAAEGRIGTWLSHIGETANFDTLLTQASHGVDGIGRTTFRALLSPEDVEDIEGGH